MGDGIFVCFGLIALLFTLFLLPYVIIQFIYKTIKFFDDQPEIEEDTIRGESSIDKEERRAAYYTRIRKVFENQGEN